MPDIMETKFTVKAGGEDFVLRVPTPFERARLGTKEAAYRKRLDPINTPNVWDLDPYTFHLIRGFAVLETLLEESSADWVWQTDKEGKLYFDSEKLPAGKEAVIEEVGRSFQEALDTFHGRSIA